MLENDESTTVTKSDPSYLRNRKLTANGNSNLHVSLALLPRDFNNLKLLLMGVLFFSILNFSFLLPPGICTQRDISISQSRSSSSGIPQYIVQIASTCMSGCAPSNIHVHCGWFASARIVNPNTFKRLSYDDCLVNAGRPLRNSHIIRFTYSNSFMYPLAFKSARFC